MKFTLFTVTLAVVLPIALGSQIQEIDSLMERATCRDVSAFHSVCASGNSGCPPGQACKDGHCNDCVTNACGECFIQCALSQTPKDYAGSIKRIV
ncbi:hypothetical protein JHW43_004625 [Diplocarpon mali]|nr:hypothetical protein JHW43_004625 [Diplocarpon mali]